MNYNKDLKNLSFDLPKNQSNVIKVIGVGGGGSNAINYMYSKGINGVDYVICNTDAQSLENSNVPNKIQLGVNLTEGLGAGANPIVGEKAAIENLNEIKSMLENNTKMVFITAGMGGGTGTGAAPIISKLAMEMGILTVGIVTMPFVFEGKNRINQANLGLEKLRKNVDALIVVNNNKLRDVYGNLGVKQGFSKADEVLTTAAKGIAEVITHHYTQNIDLKDAKTVLSKSGNAIMGSAGSSGEKRAIKAVSNALDSPLLNDNSIKGAKNVLLLILSGSSEVTIDEIGLINDYIQESAGNNVNIIMGIGEDESMIEEISVTVIATGFDINQQDEIIHIDPKKKIHYLDEETEITEKFNQKEKTSSFQFDFASSEIDFKNTHFENVVQTDKEELSKINLNEFEVEFEEVNFDEINNFSEKDETKLEDILVNEFEHVKSEDNFLKFNFNDTNQYPNNGEKKIVHMLEEDVNEIEVIDPMQVVPLTTVDNIKELEISQEITPTNKSEIISENPFENPISKILAQRTEQRKIKLKEFNYKFVKAKRIEDMESEPAYKRAGVNFENNEMTSKSFSKIEENFDGDLELKTNNSFLHDNVD